jgi:hypothetical protein
MAIIIAWRTWEADLNMTYKTAAKTFTEQGIQVSADDLRKVGVKYRLPWHND